MTPAAHNWPTNGHLIEDVAHLYPPGRTLDLTYGRGGFWTRYRPDQLVTNDLNPLTDTLYGYDFRDVNLPDNEFDTVVFDPPYKLSGTPALGDFDARYGIDEATDWQHRMRLIRDGFCEAMRLADRMVWAKCQDQVVSGKVRWQTFMLQSAAKDAGWELCDRFDMLGGGRPQPSGRRQVHARGRPSTLLVFIP